MPETQVSTQMPEPVLHAPRSLKARDLMRPVGMLPTDATVSDAADAMARDDVDLIPVGDGEQLSGVVTPRDIALTAGRENYNVSEASVDDILGRVMAFCYEGACIESVLKSMSASGSISLLVRNTTGQVVGVISMADILAAVDGSHAPSQDGAGAADGSGK